MDVAYAPAFVRQFKKLPEELQDEAIEKIAVFAKRHDDPALRVHKLKGKLAYRMSFSVNYRYRILFMWQKPNVSAILLAIGDHALYD